MSFPIPMYGQQSFHSQIQYEPVKSTPKKAAIETENKYDLNSKGKFYLLRYALLTIFSIVFITIFWRDENKPEYYTEAPNTQAQAYNQCHSLIVYTQFWRIALIIIGILVVLTIFKMVFAPERYENEPELLWKVLIVIFGIALIWLIILALYNPHLWQCLNLTRISAWFGFFLILLILSEIIPHNFLSY